MWVGVHIGKPKWLRRVRTLLTVADELEERGLQGIGDDCGYVIGAVRSNLYGNITEVDKRVNKQLADIRVDVHDLEDGKADNKDIDNLKDDLKALEDSCIDSNEFEKLASTIEDLETEFGKIDDRITDATDETTIADNVDIERLADRLIREFRKRAKEAKRAKSKPFRLRIGSITSGTLKPEDLLQAYLDACEGLRLVGDEWPITCVIHGRYFPASQSDKPIDNYDEMMDLMSEDIERLADILSAHCPDFTYFGSTEGDGADIGCWIDWRSIEDAEHDGDLLRSGDLIPAPAASDKYSYYIHVNDHGNTTMYRKVRAGRGYRWVECWSVV